MRYSFNNDEKGMVQVTISTLSDKDASPTEIEVLFKKLLRHIDNNNYTNLKINVSPLKSRKLDEKVIAKIKGLWKEDVRKKLKGVKGDATVVLETPAAFFQHSTLT